MTTTATRAVKQLAGTLPNSIVPVGRVEVAVVRGPSTPRTRTSTCTQLARNGKFLAARRASGTCQPSRFFLAKGTTTWKVKLPRRLPAGRYAIFTRVTDVNGRARTSSGDEADTMRVAR
ncbi:hypothetical protein [Conexibacter sp. SYSU D00693]|uniref:hypothetical protein n=1 Tax=Conexibacter sp. SYSU D00693 TaxID=2812560 RepID=UPI00196A22EA|nr:hypothetical protein [Conexibacter sp. SYSU D00693]